LTFTAIATDASGNPGSATRVVDNDGIPSLAPAALDRGRTGGADQSAQHSTEFTNGVTAGTLVRNGWTTKVSKGGAANAVRVQLAAGTGPAPALAQACSGAAKEVRLDVLGETADLTCSPAGSVTVKAVSAAPRIEVVKRSSATTWTSTQLPTGYTLTTGSPATAGTDNRGPLTVQVFQRDGTGTPIVIGAFELAPGASVDVTTSPSHRARGEDVHFRVLRGRVPITVDGRKRTLAANERTSVETERADRTATTRRRRQEPPPVP
jgi:mannose-6-phosphate isomerase-like protein (cupin superfamily)